MGDVHDVLLVSMGYKLLNATVAVAWLLAMNVAWNLMSGGYFNEQFHHMVKEPVAFANYHGARLVAFAIIIGFILG